MTKIPKEQVKAWYKSDIDILMPSMLTDDQLLAVQKYRLRRKEKKGELTHEDMQLKRQIEEASSFSQYIGAKSDNGNVVYHGEQDDDTFDMWAMMKDAEDPSTGTLRDITIDDRDFKPAKNYYDYAFNIIGKDANPPWSRQMWTGAMACGEVCPVCSDKKWLNINNIPKDFPAVDMPDRLVFLEYGKCPKCKREKWDLIKNHGLKNYMQLLNVWGQRSGKSSSAASYSSYIAHRYLKFPSMAGLSPMMQASTELTFTFVSLSLSKALGVLWTPFRQIILTSRWWQEYFSFLDDTGKRLGKELYRSSTMYMSFFFKNMRFYPSGPKASTLRGDTRIGFALDELGLFPVPKGDEEDAEDSTSERANADEAHKSLMNSLTTVQIAGDKLMEQGYSFVPPCIGMSVSSPVSLRDKVMRLLRQSRTEDGAETILGVQQATWHINPGIDKDSRVIRDAYALDKEKAERDYGANPPAIASTFIKREVIENGTFVSKIDTHRLVTMLDQPGEIYGRVERIGSVPYPSVVAIDAGSKNNSFSLTAGYYDFDSGKTVVSTVLELMIIEGRSVNFNLVYQHMILPVLKHVNAVVLLADQWQSLDILHRAKEDMGLNPLGKPRCLTKQWTPRRKNFDTVKSMLSQKNILLPAIKPEIMKNVLEFNIGNWRQELIGEPVGHLLLQMLTVKDPGHDKCPEKGDGFTDDIWRAFVLNTAIMHEEKVMDRLKEARPWKYDGSGQRSMPHPAFAGRSGRLMGGGLPRLR
ncbi:hypothetical protein [Burkholderia phage BCSR5]|nr:hypothetical protein [Burkholderia phage BCSR5]